jgi:Zn-dependent peptidase ImmA (M78 family)
VITRPRLGDAVLLSAIHELYRIANLVAGASPGIVHLYHLCAALPLTIDELPELTRQSATAHLRAQTGRDLLSASGTTEKLSGLLYANRAAGWILVNRSDRVVRRRFTVAHELAHYILHFRPMVETAAAADEPSFEEELVTPGDDGDIGRAHVRHAPLDPAMMEDEANRFAALLLMPEDECRRLVAKHGAQWGHEREVLARRLSTELLVSQTAMERRLEYLRLPER